ncbi:hypothetical protein BDP27DRAFT_1318020 [Rhodocollybia butyracea]|uniref:Uncharacterized protein n=1 Tax=Rhodocollybia butyracea TaxID=206335 RepID=A0A9P5PWD0_9AGAR|nr:hypothetical protein BDP27DRAFT_1318020 [Rhodocollybia butyracea]
MTSRTCTRAYPPMAISIHLRHYFYLVKTVTLSLVSYAVPWPGMFRATPGRCESVKSKGIPQLVSIRNDFQTLAGVSIPSVFLHSATAMRKQAAFSWIAVPTRASIFMNQFKDVSYVTRQSSPRSIGIPPGPDSLKTISGNRRGNNTSDCSHGRIWSHLLAVERLRWEERGQDTAVME